MFKLGAFGIIVDNKNKVLLCHRCDYDLWNLPGGKVEKGESPWEAVIREVREETGLVVEIVNLSGIYSKPDKSEVVFSFVCQVLSGQITINNEADKIEYFALDEIPSNTSPKQVERIKDYFSDKNKTFFKTQSGPSSIDLIKQGKI